MTLQLRHIKKCQWNRGWYVQLTEWIKPITLSKLKLKWMCFPHGVPWCSLSHKERMKCWRWTPCSCLLSSAQMPNHIRQKRQSHLSLCRWCCNCCRANKGCGFCCKFWGFPQRPRNINLLRFFSPQEITFSWPLSPMHWPCYTVLYHFYEVWFMEEHWKKKWKAVLCIYFVCFNTFSL